MTNSDKIRTYNNIGAMTNEQNKELLEEAIKHFKSLQKRYTTEHNGKMCEKVALALEALEKQVPAIPYKVGIDEYECPIKTCRGKLIKGYPCKCGKIIDWSDVK